MNLLRIRFLLLITFSFVFIQGFGHIIRSPQPIILSCKEDNDLYRTLVGNNINCIRFDSPEQAIKRAPNGSGVMILADGYPSTPTILDPALFEISRKKNLRIYLEYPANLPGIQTGKPSRTHWERAVIASDAFSPALQKLRIVAIHDCHFVQLKSDNPDIVVARVAGFDNAVFGIPKENFPVLTKISASTDHGELLISTTKLSQFITARYAPQDAWVAIWDHIFSWLYPSGNTKKLIWTPHVRPSFTNDESLPVDAELKALKRGIDWYFNSRTVVSPSMVKKYNIPSNDALPASANPDTTQIWPFGHRVGFMPDLNGPVGDGSLGVMEGFDAKIFYNGQQPARWWRRGDCNGEIAGAISAAGILLNNEPYKNAGRNIGDWFYFKSLMPSGDRADPKHPSYGLTGWNDVPNYAGSGSMHGYEAYYGDDNARAMLGMILSAASLNTADYDNRLLKHLLANLRISGVNGFQPPRVDNEPLTKDGWQYHFKNTNTHFSPHYQAHQWACYLWGYQQTGFDLFLTRAKKAIEMTMNAYSDNWSWTNGMQQERAKMLLPLAWLVRVDDKPLHREWLRKIADDLLAGQDKSGAIREQLGKPGMGLPPPGSNEEYGTAETPLIQSNEDKVSDMLYTVGFAFLGLHEAAASTGDVYYKDASDRLSNFLCRIQIKSEKHPELDGGWFRAFDINRWEYWASNADAGWGAWCIESGWSQSWITAVLALRQMHTSLWDLSKESKIESHFDKVRKEMLPDEVLQTIK
jgi:hypothetical protein